MATLTVHDRTATGRPVSSFELPNMPERITLRELIRLRVREEVAAYNLRPTTRFNGFVQPEDAIQEAAGYRLPKPRALDWERQADAAIESFGRNVFLPFDDDPTLSLILSKAFLLANDKAITDRSILSQIG